MQHVTFIAIINRNSSFACNIPDRPLFTLLKVFSKSMKRWSGNLNWTIDVISIGGSRMKISLLSADRAFEMFFTVFQDHFGWQGARKYLYHCRLPFFGTGYGWVEETVLYRQEELRRTDFQGTDEWKKQLCTERRSCDEQFRVEIRGLATRERTDIRDDFNFQRNSRHPHNTVTSDFINKNWNTFTWCYTVKNGGEMFLLSLKLLVIVNEESNLNVPHRTIKKLGFAMRYMVEKCRFLRYFLSPWPKQLILFFLHKTANL